MADVKITGLPSFSGVPAANIRLEMVDDPLGTPTSKQIELSDLLKGVSGLTDGGNAGRLDYFLGILNSSGAARSFRGAGVVAIINNLLTTGTFSLSDEFGLYQIAGSGARKRTVQQIYDMAGLLAALTAPQTSDLIVVYDDSAGVTKAISIGVLLGETLPVLSAFTGTIDGAADLLYFRDAGTGILHSITPNKLGGGLHTVGIPAASLRPRQSSGPAALATTSGASGQPDVPYLAFDGAAAEYATFGPFWLPKSWNAGTLKARMAWRRASGTGAADVVWAIRGLTIGDNESPAQAFGTAATVTAAASTTTANFKFSGFTGDCTLAGSPAKGDLVFLEVYRDGAAGGDTLNSVDAWLSAVELLYTTDARDDA